MLGDWAGASGQVDWLPDGQPRQGIRLSRRFRGRRANRLDHHPQLWRRPRQVASRPCRGRVSGRATSSSDLLPGRGRSGDDRRGRADRSSRRLGGRGGGGHRRADGRRMLNRHPRIPRRPTAPPRRRRRDRHPHDCGPRPIQTQHASRISAERCRRHRSLQPGMRGGQAIAGAAQPSRPGRCSWFSSPSSPRTADWIFATVAGKPGCGVSDRRMCDQRESSASA